MWAFLNQKHPPDSHASKYSPHAIFQVAHAKKNEALVWPIQKLFSGCVRSERFLVALNASYYVAV